MNSLERLIASAQGKELDRVPVAPGIGHYAAVRAGQPMSKVAFDGELMAQVQLESLQRHGYDSCGPITDYGLGTENMGSSIQINDWGQTVVIEYGVKDRGDLSRVRLPDPLNDGRMPVILECERILVDEVGDTVGVNGGLSGPLSFAANLHGLEQTLLDLVMDPELVHNLLRISLEADKSFGEAQIEYGGVKTINIYEPVTTLISSPMVEEFSFRYLEELISFLKGKGAMILLHICGDTNRMLERMIEMGTDILSLDIQVDLAEAKTLAGDRATVSGSVSTKNLSLRSAEEIYKESCYYIEKAAAGGRFTLSSSCEVPPDTPEENIDAMVRAASEFGSEFLAGLNGN